LTIRSSSSRSDVAISRKVKEYLTFLSWRLKESGAPEYFDSLFQGLEEFRSTYEAVTGQSFAQAKVFEIGYGARPTRMIALMSMGIDVGGIDLDTPMLRFGLGHLTRIYRANGLERAIKTTVRSVLFDGRDRSRMRGALRLRGHSMVIDPSRFLVGDAATYDFKGSQFDMIYSEDVFEHIPKAGLEQIVASMARTLSLQGLAIVTPDIFTGITGGHVAEWFHHLVEKDIPRVAEPWEHLRKKRYPGNTYLNRLSRADYRALFAPYFDIVEERVMHPDMGRRWLTPEIRAELSQWSEEDLLSNNVRFVLRLKH
jgi:hypothetical protein